MKRIVQKVKLTVTSALKQGWTTEQVCWSTAWGCTIGLFPIYGVTTITLGLVGMIWKLNHSILQSFNYLISPLKVLLIIPHIRLGELMMRPETPFQLSIPEFTRRFQAAPMETLGEFAMTFVHAIAGWLVVAPLWMLVSFFTMKLLVRAGGAAKTQLQEARS